MEIDMQHHYFGTTHTNLQKKMPKMKKKPTMTHNFKVKFGEKF